jgi:RecB family endonuclease NucS
LADDEIVVQQQELKLVLYKITDQKLEQVQDTSFADAKMLERRDLQKLLISNLSPLGDDLFLLAEEYREWEDSNRSIDLLCLDKQKRLVVVEIKRTEDGGHMELQAIRYAAMVSSMTLDQAVASHQRHLIKTGACVYREPKLERSDGEVHQEWRVI